MRGAVPVPVAAFLLAKTSFLEGLGIWAGATLRMAAGLIFCGLIFALELGVLAGIALAVSKLSGRIYRNGDGG